MVRETGVQSQVASYQRLKKLYLIPPCLTLSNIRYVSRVKWSNLGKEVAPSPIPRYSSYWKGRPRLKVANFKNISRKVKYTTWILRREHRYNILIVDKNSEKNILILCIEHISILLLIFSILLFELRVSIGTKVEMDSVTRVQTLFAFHFASMLWYESKSSSSIFDT